MTALENTQPGAVTDLPPDLACRRREPPDLSGSSGRAGNLFAGASNTRPPPDRSVTGETVDPGADHESTTTPPPCSAPGVHFADIDRVQRGKVLRREALVKDVLRLLHETGCSLNAAILRALGNASAGQAIASVQTVYRWVQRYQDAGLDGLVEQKRGRVGRRSYVDDIPEHVLDAARAASLEHGAGQGRRQNIARAVRNTLMMHPDMPASARAHVHGAHASKSYVNSNLRSALRVAPLASALVQGTASARLAAPFTPCDYSDVVPGQWITADDMTANVYCWIEHPCPLGYIVGRPQVLAFFDVGAWRWQTARVIMRASGQYTRDDVWGCIGDVIDTFGLYPHWLFEGGKIWRGNRVRGERTGLTDEERFGGLRSLGAELHHSIRPQSKAIESAFNSLQYEGDNCPGWCGRDEREQRPEVVADIIEQTKAGKLHPKGLLLHLSEYRAQVDHAMARLNAERGDGKILRGMTPDEAWNVASPTLPQIPDSARWLFRSSVSRVTVRRDGLIHITQRSGKWQDDHWYRNPELLVARAGQTLLAYWNDSNPEADAILLTATARPEYIGVAQYIEPLPRFSATEEQMETEARARKAAMAYAQSETIRLEPHFQRTSRSYQPGTAAGSTAGAGSTPPAPSAVCPEAERIGRELARADARAAVQAAERQAQADRVRRHGQAAAVDMLAPVSDRLPALDPEPMRASDSDGEALLDALSEPDSPAR